MVSYMCLRDEVNEKICSLALQASKEFCIFDDKLYELFESLEELDPDLTDRAIAQFGDIGIASFMLFCPIDRMDGKSVMQIAVETGKDPLEIDIPVSRNDVACAVFNHWL